jgi:hypothetical protein
MADAYGVVDGESTTEWHPVHSQSLPSRSGSNAPPYPDIQPGGRLSLVEGNPEIVPSEATRIVYYSPYLTPVVPVFNGTGWDRCLLEAPLANNYDDTTKNPSIAVGNCADLFIWDDDGELRLGRGVNWSPNGAGRPPLQWINQFRVNGTDIPNGPAQNRGTWVGTIATWPNGYSYVRLNWNVDYVAMVCVFNAYHKKLIASRVTQGVGLAGGEQNGWGNTNIAVYVVVGERTAIQIQGGVQANVNPVHVGIAQTRFNNIGMNADGFPAPWVGLTRGRSDMPGDNHCYCEAAFTFDPCFADFTLWSHGEPGRTFANLYMNPLSAIWRG